VHVYPLIPRVVVEVALICWFVPIKAMHRYWWCGTELPIRELALAPRRWLSQSQPAVELTRCAKPDHSLGTSFG